MFDIWSSEGNKDNYLSITAHYINSPKDKLDQWVLKEVQLAFAELEGHHTRVNITSILANVLKWYGICGKVTYVYCIRGMYRH